jgi:NADPH:quinone reductase-like Zn-dependent oxidoreductase
MYLTQSGGADALVRGEIPTPIPQRGEVLVKVRATAVTPTELQWFPTFHTAKGYARPFPIVLGHEFSGEIAALGPDVDGSRIGDAVYGLNDWFTNGAQAEFAVAPIATLAMKPVTLTHPQAAVVPISALTAWQGLVTRTGLKAGERVLIHGAAGGVGVFAVQLARALGAHVIATASSGNLEFVRSLGAHEVIDYRVTRFEDVARDIDVVFDGIGGETLARSWGVLAPGGRLVTIATESAGAPEPRVREAFLLVQSDRMQLAEIARRIDAGELRVFVEKEFPLTEARAAYARAARGGMRGKIVLRAGE